MKCRSESGIKWSIEAARLSDVRVDDGMVAIEQVSAVAVRFVVIIWIDVEIEVVVATESTGAPRPVGEVGFEEEIEGLSIPQEAELIVRCWLGAFGCTQEVLDDGWLGGIPLPGVDPGVQNRLGRSEYRFDAGWFSLCLPAPSQCLPPLVC